MIKFLKCLANVTGAIIDDFRDSVGPGANMSVAELKKVYEALKSENPALKLYLVRYSRQDQKEVIPYLDYFDVIGRTGSRRWFRYSGGNNGEKSRRIFQWNE